MIELDARNPADVSSPFVLDVYIGSPARHMLIFTGIAAARWDSRSDLDRTQVRVRLNRTVANLGLYTATAALSNITNTDSDFIFATDAIRRTVRPGCRIALLRFRHFHLPCRSRMLDRLLRDAR